MKKGFIAVLTLLALVLPLILSGCSAPKGFINSEDAGSSGGGYPGFEPLPDASFGDAEGDYEYGGEPSEVGKNETVQQRPNRPAGLITAAAWNDNDNYALWLDALSANGEQKFGTYPQNWGLPSENRVKVTVKSGDSVVVGALVTLTSSDGTETHRALTDSQGIAYLFPNATEGNLLVSSDDEQVVAAFTADEREIAVSLEAPKAREELIEIMFVVDVTGSMGDELEYLKNELADVVGGVVEENPEAKINLALLFYRDHTDNETFRYYDFVDVTKYTGLADRQQAIDAQRASGGGDTPEAVDEALQIAVEKQWSDSASTKLIFHVLDAPPHSADKNIATFSGAVKSAAEKGIRICPIICSGADLLTEYLSRAAALYTGGTFIFVTDDSGIGNPHHDPNLPNTVVEALNSLMIRLINGYYSGEFAPAVPWVSDNQF